MSGAHGLSLHCLSWSEVGVPLVLLHGFGNEAHIWDDFAPVVAPYYRTLAFDLRGHGDSDRDPGLRYDHDALADDLEAACAALGISRLVLVGHSYGGRVAMRFAGRHPERLAGLVIVDAGPDLDARGVLRIRLDTQRADPSFGSVAEYEGMLARAYPLARPEVIARMARHGLRSREDGRFERKTDPRFGAAAADLTSEQLVARMRVDSDALWADLARVGCPALVVRGAASDVLSSDTAERMVEQTLAKGTFAEVPRAGHSVMIDNPEGFADAVARFALGDA
ncbi:MAG: alpha/beta hydrolase [Deltaproteobacteria bacterium]|nr:alpha/beta hydrolase [Deltaproteobacteria bacterium]